MKRWFATVLVFGLCSAVVRADVTVVQTTTVEGGMAAMAGGGAPSPKITMRVKGMKSRTDMDMASVSMSSITDLVAKQMIVLRHDQKTAQIVDAAGPAAPAGAAAGTPAVKLDASVTATGKSQVIDGLKCDEYAFATTISMAEAGGAQVPPEAAEMLKDLSMSMKGSMWVAKDAPGAAEYLAFQKALAKSDLAAATAKISGVNLPGMDKMMKAMSSAEGLTYLTVLDMTIEGSGQIADMMRQMGAMKVTSKVTSISVDAISDDLFKIPEGYTVIK
jgi:hypothetical protein